MVTYIANGLLLAIPGIQAISQRVYTVMMGLPSIGAGRRPRPSTLLQTSFTP